MKKELLNTFDKELLLKDICARLPYGVKIQVPYEDGSGYFAETVWEVNNDGPFHVNGWGIEYEYVKPYLFPLSSMTEEMMEEFDSLFNGTFQYFNQGVISASYLWDRNEAKFVGEHECSKLIDFFNSHHIDYRNLIEKGLAIDATGLNIY